MKAIKYIKTLEDYFEQNIDKTTIPPVFVASEDIGWVERIETQSIIQNFMIQIILQLIWRIQKKRLSSYIYMLGKQD